ncbi:MAG: outer membrane protein assembly factor BamA, partial [Muribaculaceae bacterium]|nr:outer membrane protein assembly factor BamA [Muribaculaceae bacterium]
MRYKLLLLITLFATLGFNAKAQEQVDTIYNPNVVFTSMPRSYEIAGIKVSGADNYEDYIIIGYSGLKIGDRITVPGEDINAAAKRFWRQGLFSNVQIKVEKIAGDKVWLEFALRQQPRIATINYYGVKKGEKEDLQERLQLMKGNQITQNIVNRAIAIIEKYFGDKGFKNADVKIDLHEDLSHKNEVIVDIKVDKHEKVKVHKIYIDGNEVMSDGAIQRTMKKTNEKGKLKNLFRQKKFVESDYKDDLNRIIQKYNEKGYRDAKIVADSVVKYDEKTVDVYITV